MNIPERPEILQTLGEFEGIVAHALHEGEEWVETTPEIVKYFNRNGLKGADYFIYKGIKVCEYGKREAIVDHENEQMDYRLHGKGEGVIVGQ